VNAVGQLARTALFGEEAIIRRDAHETAAHETGEQHFPTAFLRDAEVRGRTQRIGVHRVGHTAEVGQIHDQVLFDFLRPNADDAHQTHEQNDPHHLLTKPHS